MLLLLVLALLAHRGIHDYANPRRVESRCETLQVDLNRAERAELVQLVGIGPARADNILAYRQFKGTFQNIDDLKNVDGIGDVTLSRLRPFVRVGPNTSVEDEPVRLSRKPVEASVVRIDLNSATVEELEGLPGIGRTLALRIVEGKSKVSGTFDRRLLTSKVPDTFDSPCGRPKKEANKSEPA